MSINIRGESYRLKHRLRAGLRRMSTGAGLATSPMPKPLVPTLGTLLQVLRKDRISLTIAADIDEA